MPQPRGIASREGYQKLRQELRYFSPLIKDVIVESRVHTLPARADSLFLPYDTQDVFLIIVEDLTENLFDAIPNNWYGTPVEVILNGTRKRLM
jgi:hypothetical protein